MAGAGYLAYDKWQGTESTNLWSLVPENAAIVYESKSSIEVWNKILQSDLWQSLGKIEQFSRLNNGLEILDSLSGKKGQFSRLLENDFLVSVHKTSKNSFDFLWVLDIDDRSKQKTALQILESLRSEGGFTVEVRKYLNFEIQEISNEKLRQEFSYFIYENKLIGSSTSFLVEDVARQIDTGHAGFKNANAELFNLPRLSQDEGNIYVNMDNVSQYMGLFIDSQESNNISQLSYLAGSMFFDMSIQSNKVLLNGFGISKTNDFLDVFKGQKPTKSPFKYYIPNRASMSYELLFDNPTRWFETLEEYWKSHDTQFLKRKENELKKYDFDLEKTMQWVKDGFALAEADPVSGNGKDMLFFISPKDLHEGLAQLNRISEKQALGRGDSVYTELYSDLEIRELGVEEFPMLLLGPMFSGFSNSYYTTIDGLIVFGNNIEAIKNLVIDVQSENTWGRSVKYNQFLNNNLEEYNLSMTVNTDKIWQAISEQLDDEWKTFVSTNARPLKNFRLLSTQFSALDENHYASIAIDHEKQDFTSSDKRFTIEQEVYIGRQLLSKPEVVKNHVTNQLEVVLQDSAMNLILISSEGRELWRLPLEEKIVTEIDQVDFYKNGKLQLFFATQSKVYIVDRLGNNVENYPVTLSDYKIMRASVLDYDRSRNYRFLISDDKGNLCLMNKEGVLLEGWNPNKVGGRLTDLPFHIRVRGKDVIIAIQEDGTVNVMNRRGEMLPGFPLQTGGRTSGKPFVKKGNTLSKTTLVVMSEDGKLTEFSLSGDIVNSDQFYRPTLKTKFKLSSDALGKSYIIARQDENRLVLLDHVKNEILSKDYLSDEILKIQYYDFSADNKVYAVTDETQGFTYLYNTYGTLVNSQPFNSNFEIAMMFFETKVKYQIYAVSEKSLKVLSF